MLQIDPPRPHQVLGQAEISGLKAPIGRDRRAGVMAYAPDQQNAAGAEATHATVTRPIMRLVPERGASGRPSDA